MTNGPSAEDGAEQAPDLAALYYREFQGSGDEGLMLARAPGRVNLIGEHTDYNEGFVLPVAVDREVRVLGARRPDRRVDMYAANFERRASFDLDALALRKGDDAWLNLPQGVADALQRAGHRLTGANLVMWGNVPPAAGMSSSAAVEIACLFALTRLAGLELDPRDDARLARHAENDFVGVQTGIMDQFASRLGKSGHALLLDCRSLAYAPIPMDLPGIVLGVVHSGVPRGLAGSKYNERREECAEGVRLLQQVLPDIRALRDVQPAEFALVEERLPAVIRKRCRHVIMEDARVGEAAEALRAGDVARLGALFARSQASMRADYAITVPEIDTLVEVALAHGSMASRMTGGGFGGCTVNLVPEERWDAFTEGVMTEYPRVTGRTPTIYRCRAVDGATIETVSEAVH
ncbi:MAG: galactokinase [Chloroflexota bacterium]|nr:galactokinase [Chloroflexota bacterium]